MVSKREKIKPAIQNSHMMSQQNTNNRVLLEQLIQTIKAQHIPDERLAVFAIKLIEKEDAFTLSGKTTNREAYHILMKEAIKIDPNIKDNIRVLPNKDLGEKQWAIVTNSVADLRYHPAHPSELVTQVLLGMPVKLLDKKNEWLQVQTPEGYIGWTTIGSLHLLTRKELNDYLKRPKVIVTSHYALSYSEPTPNSERVSDIVIGNTLVVNSTLKDYYSVNYPDGREAYIPKEKACMMSDWINNIELTRESIIATAKQFMGVPYVWGGTSSKGLDCSGLVKLVFFMHGLIIARDASQQIKYGYEVDIMGNFDTLQIGDLAFFGEKATDEKPNERVVHVGIYIGNQEFIHASDNVHISSFNPDSPLYDAFNTNRYLRSMRYLGHEDSRGIEPITTHPYYLPQE